MNGGYIIISKNQADAYALSLKALELGKPILWYEDANTCYYIDTITKSGTDIVLTKGGKTITIENDGDVTESGNIQTLIEDIKDKDGNKRFVEGELSITDDLSNLTINYNKWSLSGYHLMLVLEFTNDTESTITLSPWINMALCNLPSYIVDKIIPIGISTNVALNKTKGYNSALTESTYTLYSNLTKTDGKIYIQAWSSVGNTNDIESGFTYRLQYDLIIDNE